MIDQVRNLTHEMRLFGLRENAEHRSAAAMADSLHPLEFLRLLLEDEKLYRKNVVAKRLVSKAQFRHEADLENWDQSFDRGITKPKLRELACLGFYHTKENLLIYGKTGEGKTRLAISIGKRLCDEGIITQFHSVNLLFEEIAAQKVSGKYLNFLRQITKAQAIILDDFGLRNYSHEEATLLLDILEARYQKGIVIVTTQVDSRGWGKLFEDSVIREAIIDRLTKPSQQLTLAGGSYRDRIQNANNAKTGSANQKKS